MTRALAFGREIKNNTSAFGTILSVTERYVSVRLDNGTRVGQVRLSSQVSDPAIGDRASLVWDKDAWVCIATIGASYKEIAPSFVTTVVQTTAPSAHTHLEAHITDLDKYSMAAVDSLFASHTAVPDAHHALVSIGVNTRSSLLLDGQELSLLDVFLGNTTDEFVGTLTVTGDIVVTGTVDGIDLSDHAANDSAHHAPITLGTNTANALTLTGQTIGIADKFLRNVTDELIGDLTVTGNILTTGTVDGIDISEHAADPEAHHKKVTIGTTNHGTALSIDANQVIGLADKFLLNTGDTITGTLFFEASAQSPDYASKRTGWQVNNVGHADFRNVFANEIHVESFIADIEQALAGGQIISKSVVILAEDFIVPSTSGDIVVEDIPGYPTIPVFAAGDHLRLQVIVRGTGFSTYYVHGTVSGTPVTSDGKQTWTFTRTSGTSGGTVFAGAIVLDLGQSGDGYWQTTAIGDYAPYAQVATWDTTPTNLTVHTRLGQLQGVTGFDEYGFWAGNGTQYIKATAAGLELTGVVNIVNPGDINTGDLNNTAGWTTDATANQAIADAATAQGTANTAVTDAFNAQSTANTAVSDAATAQSTANTAISNAASAQSTADTAVSNAAAAQFSADSANSLLSDIASDNKLTPDEKQSTKKEWDSIVSEVTLNDAQAVVFGITTEKTTYDNAYSALDSYISPLLLDLNVTSDIVGITFRSTFKSYYDARTQLLNAISLKAKTLAGIAQNTADDAIADAAAAQATANASALTANWPNISNIPSTLGTPAGTGLFLSSTEMGFYDNGTWKTYMDKFGKFYLSGPSGHGLGWTGSDLSISGDVFVQNTTPLPGQPGGGDNSGGSISVDTYGIVSIGDNGRLWMGKNSLLFAEPGSEIEFGQTGGDGYLHYFLDVDGKYKLIIEGEIIVRGGNYLPAKYDPVSTEFAHNIVSVYDATNNEALIRYGDWDGSQYLVTHGSRFGTLRTRDGSVYNVASDIIDYDLVDDMVATMSQGPIIYIYVLKNGATETALLNDGYTRYGIDDADSGYPAGPRTDFAPRINAFVVPRYLYTQSDNHVIIGEVTFSGTTVTDVRAIGNSSYSSISPYRIVTDNLSSISADIGYINAGSITIGSSEMLWLNSGNDDLKLAVGGTDRLNAPFRVYEDGKFAVGSAEDYLYWDGTQLTIRGHLLANSGTFNGTVRANDGYFGNDVDKVIIDNTGLDIGQNGTISWANGLIENKGLYVSEASTGALFSELRVGHPIGPGVEGFLDINMAKPVGAGKEWNYAIHIKDGGNNTTAAAALYYGYSNVAFGNAVDNLFSAKTENGHFSYSNGFNAEMGYGSYNDTNEFDSRGVAFRGKSFAGGPVAVFNQTVDTGSLGGPVVVTGSTQSNAKHIKSVIGQSGQIALYVDNDIGATATSGTAAVWAGGLPIRSVRSMTIGNGMPLIDPDPGTVAFSFQVDTDQNGTIVATYLVVKARDGDGALSQKQTREYKLSLGAPVSVYPF